MPPRFGRLVVPLACGAALLWGLTVPSRTARGEVPDGGPGVPISAFEYGRDGLLYPAPIRPDPTWAASPGGSSTPAESQASGSAAQGWDAMNRGDWAAAQDCFAKSLGLRSDERVRKALMTAQTFALYERNMQEAKQARGRAMVGMSDCLRALSSALADLKSSVASGALARSMASGAAHEPSSEPVLSEASIVDLRAAATGVVALERLRRSSMSASQPILPPGSRRLTDRQAATLANVFLKYELGYAPSESDITGLLGLPPPGAYERSGGSRAPGIESERTQIGKALESFREDLVRGCNDALRQASLELEADPVTKKIRAQAAAVGADRVDPGLKAIWDERNQQAQARLLTRFTFIQDLALQKLGTRCTMVFRNAPSTPPPPGPSRRRTRP